VYSLIVGFPPLGWECRRAKVVWPEETSVGVFISYRTTLLPHLTSQLLFSRYTHVTMSDLPRLAAHFITYGA